MRPGSKDLKGFPEPASDDVELKSLVSVPCLSLYCSLRHTPQTCQVVLLRTRVPHHSCCILRRGRYDAPLLLPLLLWWSRHRALTSCSSTKSPSNLLVGCARVQPCLHCCSSMDLGCLHIVMTHVFLSSVWWLAGNLRQLMDPDMPLEFGEELAGTDSAAKRAASNMQTALVSSACTM